MKPSPRFSPPGDVATAKSRVLGPTSSEGSHIPAECDARQPLDQAALVGGPHEITSRKSVVTQRAALPAEHLDCSPTDSSSRPLRPAITKINLT